MVPNGVVRIVPEGEGALGCRKPTIALDSMSLAGKRRVERLLVEWRDDCDRPASHGQDDAFTTHHRAITAPVCCFSSRAPTDPTAASTCRN